MIGPGRLREQHGHQGLGGTHPLELPEKLAQRRALIATAKQRRERMLAGIELAEMGNPQQGRKKQCLKPALKRQRTVIQQGKVIVWMPLLMGFHRQRELSHYRAKRLALAEPMGKRCTPTNDIWRAWTVLVPEATG